MDMKEKQIHELGEKEFADLLGWLGKDHAKSGNLFQAAVLADAAARLIALDTLAGDANMPAMARRQAS